MRSRSADASSPVACLSLALLLALVGCASRVTSPPPRHVEGPPPAHRPAPALAAAEVARADRLVDEGRQQRATLERARDALRKALRYDPGSYAVLWRLARVCFLLSDVLNDSAAREAQAEAGIARAQQAITADPHRVEGHYYLAVNTGTLADVRSKLSLVKPTLRAAEKAAEIDASYDHAGPLVLMGKLYLQAPPWPLSVGNTQKAVELLERALALAPRPLTRMFLGQAYAEDDQPQKARRALEQALHAAGPDALPPKWRREAEKALARLGR